MPTDEELMAAYVAGDDEAFQTLFRRYTPWLLGMLGRGLFRREEAQDLLQQTFLQIHRARADFRSGHKLRPWVIAIALNVKREHLRRTKRRGETQLDETGQHEPGTTVGDPERAAEAAGIRRALKQLPEAQQEVLELHWFEGLPFSEIAEIVGANHSAVKVRAHRAYKQLRQLLSGSSDVTAGSPATYDEK